MILKTSIPNDRTPSAAVCEERALYYLITIRKCKVFDLVSSKELESVIDRLKYINPAITLINECYETGGHYGQLHVHLVVRSLRRLNYRTLKYYQGFYVDYKPLDTIQDVHRAQIYVSKEQYQSFCFAQALLA